MFKSVILIGLFILLGRGCAFEEPPYIEVTTQESVFEERFYYEQLSKSEKLIYQEIYEGISTQQKEICVHSTDADEANEVLLSVVYDFPEFFWIDGSASSTTYGQEGAEGSYTIMEPVYLYSGEKKEQMQQEIETAVEEIIHNVPEEYDEYEKIKYIYEYLIRTVEYVENAADSQNMYSALVNHETVCAGYAKANQYLLNELGINCTYVLGTAEEEGVVDNHAWNIVECNGNYYYIDITWADPMKAEGEEEVPSDMTYDYLCCSEAELADSHTLQPGYEYPECVSEDLNYYRANGMFYDSVDRTQLLNAAYLSIDEKSGSTTFKFANKELYEQVKGMMEEDIIPASAQYLCNKHGIDKIEYYYCKEDLLNKVVIYWMYE